MHVSNYWNVQLYLQGELVSIDVVEAAEVQPLTQHFERKGYEVRSEPAWKPAHRKTQSANCALQDRPEGRSTHGQDLEPSHLEVWR